MIIESIDMIDRMRRAHLALMALYTEAQIHLKCEEKKYIELENEIKECEKIIEHGTNIIKDDRN